MRGVIVYDFDKTLTTKDTLFGFFKEIAKRDLLYPGKLFLYMGAMVGAKVGLLSNTALKKLGVRLFVKGATVDEVAKASSRYAKKIPFNRLYHTLRFAKGSDYYVVSASFTCYLRPLFPKEVQVIGSNLSFNDERVNALAFNCYKEAKVEALQKVGVEEISLLYTDSISDLALAKIAKKIVVVEGDKETVCRNIEEFRRYFRR